MRGRNEPGRGGREPRAACLTSFLFMQNLVSGDAFMLFQNIDDTIFILGHVFYFLLLII